MRRRPGRVLRVLASLAPDRRTPTLDVSGAGPTRLAWLGAFGAANQTGDPTTSPNTTIGDAPPTTLIAARTAEIQALARHDALTPDAADLRVGWMWIVGDAEVAGTTKRIVLPLLSRPVTIARIPLRMSVTPLGSWDLWPLVGDEQAAARLEREAAFGGGALGPDTNQALVDRLHRLRHWVDQVVEASGLPPVSALLAPNDVSHIHPSTGLVAVVGFAAFVDQVVDLTRPQETLTAWTRNPQSARTAFASVYLGAPSTIGGAAGPGPHPAAAFAHLPPPPAAARDVSHVVSPTLLLNDRQSEVVLRARHAPVTVVSGPPGTGKSQTAAAVALDCVARGESVLVATRSAVAADVLARLLDRLPGPDPILFGGSVRARKLAAQLADGLAAPPGPEAQARLARAEHDHTDLEGAVRTELDDLRAADEWARRSLTLPRHALAAPLLLDPCPTATTDEAATLLDRARRPGGWFSDRRRRRASQALHELVGAPSDTTIDSLADAVGLARLRDRAERATRRDPARSDRTWAALVRSYHERRMAVAAALAVEVSRRADGAARRAVAALATALRAGRATRRSHLARVDMASLTRALPLWVGTLGEIESLLPAGAAAFDVVVLDEASQIDQFAASAALLRAERAVVIGDPRQLRFVSFVPDRDVSTAIEAEQCGHLADRLDVRRVSAFDLAAGAAPVTFLDEHYRSVPHLIGFSAERFYDGRLLVATRHPANECEVAIEVRRLEGTRNDGVNQVEVEAALATVEDVVAADPSVTVGVVSPYRQQIDAIEAGVGDRVDLAVLQSGRVRVGTVHGFQGAECDVVIASFGIGGATDQGRRFLEDPNLFNVLVTRARRRLIVLSSGDEPATGLLADYLRWAAIPPVPPAEDPPGDEWTSRLATVLRDAGSHVRAGYPVGRWRVDLVVGEGDTAVGVTTRLHPDGPVAHVRRHLALASAGWYQAAAFPSDRDGDVVATALALSVPRPQPSRCESEHQPGTQRLDLP